MTDFYEDWEESVLTGPKPVTVDQKIEHGLQWYSGDSGVSQEELEAYLRDLVETARAERPRRVRIENDPPMGGLIMEGADQ